jgi:hypothetical protein
VVSATVTGETLDEHLNWWEQSERRRALRERAIQVGTVSKTARRTIARNWTFVARLRIREKTIPKIPRTKTVTATILDTAIEPGAFIHHR